MRLEGQSKLGYYPPPEHSLRLITMWLRPAGDGLRRYLDPCCGQGEALAAIAHAAGPAETYGIELSDARAEVAQSVLTRIVHSAYENAVLADETFSLCLLNPPYDGQKLTGGGTRLEETFLLTTTPRLAPGGVLIYMIPHARVNERIARHLAGWYDQLRCFTLPADDYAAFKQCVIFGVRRSEYVVPSGDEVRFVATWANGMQVAEYRETLTTDKDDKQMKAREPVLAPLPELGEGHGEYGIPPSPLHGKHNAAFRFQYVVVSEEQYQREADAAAARLEVSREWRDLVPAVTPPVVTPAMTPKRGHIAMQMSAGVLGTNRVRTTNGQPLLLKGHVRKYSVTKLHDDNAEPVGAGDRKQRLQKVEVEERFETLLTTVSADGAVTVARDPLEVGRLLEQYVEQLAEIVQARNAPQYDLKPAAWEWSVFDALSRERRLPGRDETGLTEFQKHLAIALGRVCLAQRAGFCNAEMGSGKTTIGIAAAEYLDSAQQRRGARRSAYPALVVGPAIVTGRENWPREIAEVVPGAIGRVVDAAAKPLPKAMTIAVWLESLGISGVTDIDAPVSAKVGNVLEAIERAAQRSHVPLTRAMWAALRQSLAQAAKHPPTRRRGLLAPNLLDGRIGGYLWLELDVPRDADNQREIAGAYSLAQFVNEYKQGMLPRQSFAIMSFETAKLGAGRVPAMGRRLIKERLVDEEGNAIVRRLVACTCPDCGAVVAEKYGEAGEPIGIITPQDAERWIGLRKRYCQAPLARRVWDAEHGKHVAVPGVCGAPLFEQSALRREAAARYIRKKVRCVFGLLLVDEIHKCKAKGTGTGWALTALHNSCRWTIGLTGTLFGGYATSIFWLLYRLAPDVRSEFGFSDERRWAERYGLLKTVFYVDPRAVDAEQGAFTGVRQFETVSEKPGISPAIASIGLKYCTFSSLKDIGLPLPSYREDIVRLDMTPPMAEQYAAVDGSQERPPAGLFAWALEERKKEDGKGAIGVWLNAALNRPDAMFRAEEVVFNRPALGGRFAKGRFRQHAPELVRTLPEIVTPGEWLPKEAWIAQRCVAERASGRKTLVFVRQTGTRDIQPRLVSALEVHGLRAGILRPSLEPAKRASWLKAHADRFDVLLTNVRLVEVGLNLTMYSTAIFAEIEWSLYALWQGMRRLYRPGAPLPVQLYFTVYDGTLEANALDLIGAKMKAAQIFYGDEVGGSLVDEGDDGDLLNDLVRKALGQINVGRAEGIFASGNAIGATTSPLGSPTAVSPRLTTLDELIARLRRGEIAVARRSRGRLPTAVGQMGLW